MCLPRRLGGGEKIALLVGDASRFHSVLLPIDAGPSGEIYHPRVPASIAFAAVGSVKSAGLLHVCSARPEVPETAALQRAMRLPLSYSFCALVPGRLDTLAESISALSPADHEG